jgi:hypothetical protein
MSKAQKKAVENYRRRLARRGVKRFEVQGLDSDRVLIRALAKRLAENDPEAARLRSEIGRAVGAEQTKGSLLEILRRWPIGDIEFHRPFETGRKVDL